MKVLVTGSGGQLGRTLTANAPAGLTMIGVDLPETDIRDKDAVRDVLQREQPDVIVNTAAWTAVDLAESQEAEATRVNVDGAQNLAAGARDIGSRLIHISTDFVFDGESQTPYAPESTANPASVYGKTKYEGERRVLEIMPDSSIVLRTAWLYSEYGGNFVSTMLRLMRERDEISVVNDQIGTPTWARSVADVIFAFIENPGISGTYHWTDSGQASWYDFACAIQEEAIDLGQIETAIGIRPISSEEYAVAAKRPAFSVLDCSATERALGIEATPWRESLRAMLEVSTSQ